MIDKTKTLDENIKHLFFIQTVIYMMKQETF